MSISIMFYSDGLIIRNLFGEIFLEISFTSKNTVSIMINRINPIPKCIVTRTACNFSTITNPPRIICPTTNADAIIDAIFVDLLVSCDLRVKNMVTKTIMPVVAATVLWKYSMINSFIGTSPAGHKGQSGQLSPTPDELTYPPINIRANNMDNVEKESFVRSISDNYCWTLS